MIEVIPHVGRKANGEEVVLDQLQVMVSGRRVAYCGTKVGSPINFIRPVSDAEKTEIVEAVKKAIKGEPGKVSIPKPLSQAAKKYMERNAQ